MANEGAARVGYLLIDNEDKLSNCFSINQLLYWKYKSTGRSKHLYFKENKLFFQQIKSQNTIGRITSAI